MKLLHGWILVGWILALAGGFAAGLMYEQRDDGGENTYLDSLADKYDLRHEQVEKIKGLLTQEGHEIHGILSGVEADVKDRIRTARAKTEESVRGVLDEEQRRKFDEDRNSGKSTEGARR